ncbi:hypothetical protein OEA41_008087 [Lepraria neglecta]|uniref:NDT80 domain-containing protein n=1 Tax=Lepraria neglecta TaxID=209136 RepID=A0AAD9ZEG6_9LECA|nr:hypothetical protein OEA41_008087 [Lepraria neglecta]
MEQVPANVAATQPPQGLSYPHGQRRQALPAMNPHQLLMPAAPSNTRGHPSPTNPQWTEQGFYSFSNMDLNGQFMDWPQVTQPAYRTPPFTSHTFRDGMPAPIGERSSSGPPMVFRQDIALHANTTPSDMENILQSEGEDADIDQSIPEDNGGGDGDNEQIQVGGDRRPKLPMSLIPFETTVKVQPIYDEGGRTVPVILDCKMPRPFGYLDKEGAQRWVAYRRNYFEPIVSIELQPPSSNDQGHLTTNNTSGRMTPVLDFRVRPRGYRNVDEEVEMVQFDAARDPLHTGWGLSDEKTGPAPVKLRPRGEGVYPKSTGDPSLQTQHKFRRTQFKASTNNNGMRRSRQTYYHVRIQVEAEVQGDNGETEWVLVASCRSGPLIIRGRSPKSFEAPQPELQFHNRRRKDEIKVEEPRPAGEKNAKVRKPSAKSRGRQKSSRDALPSRMTALNCERPQRRTRASQALMMLTRDGEDTRIKSEPTDEIIGDFPDYASRLAEQEFDFSGFSTQSAVRRATRSHPNQLQQRVPGPPEKAYSSSDSFAYSDSPGSGEDTDDPSDPTYGSTYQVDAQFRRQGRHR